MESMTFKYEDGSPELVFPKSAFKNAAEFFHSFEQMAIPFMDGYRI